LPCPAIALPVVASGRRCPVTVNADDANAPPLSTMEHARAMADNDRNTTRRTNLRRLTAPTRTVPIPWWKL
jgi:hypothetical protein